MLFLYSSSRKNYEFENNIKIDLEEGSDFEPNENQGEMIKCIIIYVLTYNSN